MFQRFIINQSIIISLMKLSEILKKRPNQSLLPSTGESQTASSKIWGKHSLIFSQSKTQFMHGLLALVQKRANSLCESFEDDQDKKQQANLENESKNDVKTNPFLMVKARLLKQKESLQTQNSSMKDRLHLDNPLERASDLQDRKTVTWKQLLQQEKKKRKAMLRPFTDRK